MDQDNPNKKIKLNNSNALIVKNNNVFYYII